MSSAAIVNPLRRIAKTHVAAPSMGGMAQELLNRLTPLAACHDELRRMNLPDDVRPLVEIAAHATARTARTVRSLAVLGACRLVSRTPCNPNDLVAAAAREFAPLCGALGTSFEVGRDPDCQPVMLDLARFSDGLAHVMDVAADSCSLLCREAGPRLLLRVESSRDGGEQGIAIRCNGAPVPDEAARAGFFAPLGCEPPPAGTALALFLARSALCASGAELRMSEGDGWTQFHIALSRVPGRQHERSGRTSGPPDLRVILGAAAGWRAEPDPVVRRMALAV
jgi:hypothetical protein